MLDCLDLLGLAWLCQRPWPSPAQLKLTEKHRPRKTLNTNIQFFCGWAGNGLFLWLGSGGAWTGAEAGLGLGLGWGLAGAGAGLLLGWGWAEQEQEQEDRGALPGGSW